jgi:alcohol dehydrogenase class IV
MTQETRLGIGVIGTLGSLLQERGCGRVFLVAGRSSFERSGAASVFTSLVAQPFKAADQPFADVAQPFRAADRRLDFVRFDRFDRNPKLEDIVAGVEAFRSGRYDAVVAVGGGTAIDVAKLINALAPQSSSPADIVQGSAKIERRGLPLFVAPTTAGSGSEATHFAVVYVDKEKYSVAHPSLLPDVALIDPQLTASMSPSLTAVTGLDAFAQAVESYWSVHSTDESKDYAREAIGLVLTHLKPAVIAPTLDARCGMSRAAHLAGKAINITRTTGAHAMSYPMTAHFGVPHGHAVALTLGELLVFNAGVSDADVNDARGAGYVHRAIGELASLLGCESADDCRRAIGDLMRDVGLETRLSQLGISEPSDVELIARNSNAERAVNNPRALTHESIRALLHAVR